MNARRMIQQAAAALVGGALVFGAVAIEQGEATTFDEKLVGGELVECHHPSGSTAWVPNGEDPGAGWTCLLVGTMVGVSTDVSEDDPRWDCRTMGNLVCGSFFDQGLAQRP